MSNENENINADLVALLSSIFGTSQSDLIIMQDLVNIASLQDINLGGGVKTYAMTIEEIRVLMANTYAFANLLGGGVVNEAKTPDEAANYFKEYYEACLRVIQKEEASAGKPILNVEKIKSMKDALLAVKPTTNYSGAA